MPVPSILPVPSTDVNLFLRILRCLPDGQRLSSAQMATPVYFISDVHLTLDNGDWEQTRRRRLFKFFDMIRETGGTLVIVGDFFDLWFEYRQVIPKGYFDVISQLDQLRKANIAIHYIVGNHDYWTIDFLNEQLGIHVYPANAEIEIDGVHLHLTHGDGLLSKDTGYRLMRFVLRSRLCIFLYRWLHPDLGLALAQSASRLSRKYNHADSQGKAKFNELAGYAQARWNEGADIVVMGHYHLNRLRTEKNGKSFLCLGDWISHYTYGKLAQGQLTLETWPA